MEWDEERKSFGVRAQSFPPLYKSMEPEIEETLQFQSMLADYNDRAFEIEVESEMNAAKLKRKMIKEEKALICKQKNDERKLLE